MVQRLLQKLPATGYWLIPGDHKHFLIYWAVLRASGLDGTAETKLKGSLELMWDLGHASLSYFRDAVFSVKEDNSNC